jgi:hydrogenase maturation protease
MFMPDAASTVVIGLGNPLMCDDGIGLAALERLAGEWQFDPPVELVDGGTWGLNLLPTIESAGRVLLLDAIDVGAAPGTTVTLQRNELPRLLQLKVSPHQIAVSEVLALAELRGTLPTGTVALGLQPERVELAAALSATCDTALDALIDIAIAQLEAWGHAARKIPDHGVSHAQEAECRMAQGSSNAQESHAQRACCLAPRARQNLRLPAHAAECGCSAARQGHGGTVESDGQAQEAIVIHPASFNPRSRKPGDGPQHRCNSAGACACTS